MNVTKTDFKFTVTTFLPKSINVVECDYFRALLLLLRESLHDSDIPRRTKMREAIFQEFHHYIPELKKHLDVIFRDLLVITVGVDICYTERSRKSKLYNGYVVIAAAMFIPGDYGSLDQPR